MFHVISSPRAGGVTSRRASLNPRRRNWPLAVEALEGRALLTSWLSLPGATIASLVTDSAGAVYVSGAFTGTVDFAPGQDGGERTSYWYQEYNQYVDDAYIAKYDTAGSLVWVRTFECLRTGGFGNALIAVQPDGSSVYAVGRFQVDYDFGNNAVLDWNDSYDGVWPVEDTYLVKLDAAQGDAVWAISIGGPQGDYPTAVAVDPSGHVYTTGTISYNQTASAGEATVGSTGSTDPILLDPPDGTFGFTYLTHHDPAGNVVFADLLVRYESGVGFNAIQARPQGDPYEGVYLTGGFVGAWAPDPDHPEGLPRNTTSGSTTAVLLKYSLGGVCDWAVSMPRQTGYRKPASSVGVDLELDTSGYIITTGGFLGNIAFNVGKRNEIALSSLNGAEYVARCSNPTNGTDPVFAWAKPIKLAKDSQSNLERVAGGALALDDQDHIFTSGTYRGTVDFDPGAGKVLRTANQMTAYLLKLYPDGRYYTVRTPVDDDPAADSSCIVAVSDSDVYAGVQSTVTRWTTDLAASAPVIMSETIGPSVSFLGVLDEAILGVRVRDVLSARKGRRL
jgi:hypothetical protein